MSDWVTRAKSEYCIKMGGCCQLEHFYEQILYMYVYFYVVHLTQVTIVRVWIIVRRIRMSTTAR